MSSPPFLRHVSAKRIGFPQILVLASFLLCACPRSMTADLPELLVASGGEGGASLLLRWNWNHPGPVLFLPGKIRAIVPVGRSPVAWVAAGREIYRVGPKQEAPEFLARFEGEVDSVSFLPGGDGLVLEHPPGDSSERQGPHRIHRVREDGSPAGGPSWEVHALAYDLKLSGSRAVVTWLQGRDIEWSDVEKTDRFERVSLRTGEPDERRNLRAVIRGVAFDSGGRFAWFIENAILHEDEVEPEGVALWRFEFMTRQWRRFPLESRGYFQGGLVLLPTGQLLANGFDRLLLITLGDSISERVITLPGHFRALALDPRGDRVFLGGSTGPPPQPGFGRLLVVALNPLRIVRTERLALPVEVLSVVGD